MTCEHFTFSLGLEADCLSTSSLDTPPSQPSNGTPTPAPCSELELPMGGFQASKLSRQTCAMSISADGPGAWIASQRASLVRIFQQQAKARESMASAADSIVKSSAQLMLFDPPSCGSKTARSSERADAMLSLPTSWRADTPGATESLGRLMLAHHISATDGGASLPTLTVCGNYNRKGASPKSGDGIATALRKMPTLLASSGRKGGPNAIHGSGSLSLPASIARLQTVCATDWKAPYSAEGYAKQTQVRSKPLRDTLVHTTGHRLTSAFAEWWMGWPLGWTGLPAQETAKSHSKRRQHGSRSAGRSKG